jgi:transposase-like protein
VGALKDERNQAMKRAYESGKSINAVAREFGLPESTCRRYLLEVGTVLRQQGYSPGSHGARRRNNGRGLLGWLYQD